MEPIEEGCPATQRGIHLGCGISGGCNQHSSTNMGFHDGCFFLRDFMIFSQPDSTKKTVDIMGYCRDIPETYQWMLLEKMVISPSPW
jgi:hypothetical protein